jgi:hypothetical protein
MLVCTCIQTAHAYLAYEAGVHIFDPSHFTALEMAGFQFIPAITADLFDRGVLTAPVRYKKSLNAYCKGVTIYLLAVLLLECYLLTLGTPFSYKFTQFLAYSSIVINGAITTYLMTKLYPK